MIGASKRLLTQNEIRPMTDDEMLFEQSVSNIKSARIRRFKPNEPHIRHSKVSRETMRNVGDTLLLSTTVPGFARGLER
jgi:hypothetical protein